VIQNKKNTIKIKDLPIYNSQRADLTRYRFLEDDPLLFERSIRSVRVSIQKSYDNFTRKYGSAQKAVDGTKMIASQTRKFLTEDSTMSKAAAITFGGFAGLLMGLRRGAFRMALYSSAGLLLMTTFCYPNETVKIIRCGAAFSSEEIRKRWPKSAGDVSKLPDEIDLTNADDNKTRKDNDLYSSRSSV